MYKHTLTIILLIGGVTFLVNSTISKWTRSYAPDAVGNAFFPRITSLLLCILLVIVLLQEYFKERDFKRFIKTKVENNDYSLKAIGFIPFILFSTIISSYIFVAWKIGIFVTTLVYMAFLQFYLGVRLKHLIFTSILGATLIYSLVSVANIFFPKGLLF